MRRSPPTTPRCGGGASPRRRAARWAALALALVLLTSAQKKLDGPFVQGFFGSSSLHSHPCCGHPCSQGAPRHSRLRPSVAALRASSSPDAAAGSSSSKAAAAAAPPSDFRRGQEFDGEVVHISDHGAVVRLAGKETCGFLHVSEMKDGYVHHPGEEVDKGQQVRVRVLKAAPGFLGLTMKNIGRKAIADFMIGQEVTGRVRTVKPFGAFIDIGTDRAALLHKKEMKEDQFVEDARQQVEVGDEIVARVKWKDEASGQIELSMKSGQVFMPLQRGLKLADFREGQELGGQVTGVRDFGCFVDVGAEDDGLVHVRNINDGLVNKVAAVLRPGDSVAVQVVSMRDGKLELALVGPPPRLPAVDAFQVSADEWLEGEVVGRVQFGVFVEVEDPGGKGKVTAFLGYKQIPDTDTDNLKENMKPGNKVKVRVIKVSNSKRQVFLTMKPAAEASEQRAAPEAEERAAPKEEASS